MKRHYIVLLFLHAALAVLAGQLRLPLDNILSCSTDYSTEYAYDRNANITSLSRQGIIDKVGFRNEYGLHSRYTMQYSRNQLWRMEIEKEGADYEGRTGVGATGNISDFRYDANGNLGRDLSRDILETRYSRLNKPVDVYFLHGHRQTVTYDGFGNKRRVTYSQTSDPILATMMGVPEDSAYTLQGRRNYIGPHVFANDSLEYSAFPGGYFTPEGTFYYITDWQGNNIAVFSADGKLKQQTTYYPYGEPTIEPAGQRWLFGGKEREHAGGRNSYDYGARNLTPLGSWSSADPLATDFSSLSPFSYCGGDPINYVDRDGRAFNFVTAAIGFIGGAIVGGGIELTKQILSKGNSINWRKVAGASAQGAIVGTVAGLTLGASLAVTYASSAAASVVGGTIDRVIQGEETTVADVVYDAAIGTAAVGVSRVAGSIVKGYVNNLSNKAKGIIGESVTRIKYAFRGYKTNTRHYEVETGYKTPKRGDEAVAKYDFLFENIFTGKTIIRESKFNKSGLTPNQKAAWNRADYPIDTDHTTSDDFKNWTEIIIRAAVVDSRQ